MEATATVATARAAASTSSRGPAERQDRAVVVRVGVDVEQVSPPAEAMAAMTGPVTSLADVDDALG